MLSVGDLVKINCLNTRYMHKDKIVEVIRISNIVDLIEVKIPGERWTIMIKSSMVEKVFVT